MVRFNIDPLDEVLLSTREGFEATNQILLLVKEKVQ
jgi:hypothetical protein